MGGGGGAGASVGRARLPAALHRSLVGSVLAARTLVIEGATEMGKLSNQPRDKLKKISTATLTTALFKRGMRNQMIQDVHPLNPNTLPMVGEAFTLRYIPAREDLNPITVFQDRKHPQRAAIEECPPGAVF